MSKKDLVLEDLHKIIHYEPETGVWTWKISRKGPATKSGARAGCIKRCNSGKGALYRIIKIYGTSYSSARLAWFYMTGQWPSEIDHINRKSTDDRWDNLREVTHKENMDNAGVQKNPYTGRFESESYSHGPSQT